jgi:hypothetical protein
MSETQIRCPQMRGFSKQMCGAMEMRERRSSWGMAGSTKGSMGTSGEWRARVRRDTGQGVDRV